MVGQNFWQPFVTVRRLIDAAPAQLTWASCHKFKVLRKPSASNPRVGGIRREIFRRPVGNEWLGVVDAFRTLAGLPGVTPLLVP